MLRHWLRESDTSCSTTVVMTENRHGAELLTPIQVLCDQLGVGCSLVRGEYGRHWNEVTLVEGGRAAPQLFIVDLMFQPGHLMPGGSPDAEQYQHI